MVMGDMNIAPRDEDIGIGPENAKRWLRTGKTSFLPEERDWFERLLGWGLTDSYRARYPDTRESALSCSTTAPGALRRRQSAACALIRFS